MQQFFKTFDYKTLNEKTKNKYFEQSYDRHLPEAIRQFFPKNQGDKLLNDYYAGDEELIQQIYNSGRFPGTVPYLCERLEQDLSKPVRYRGPYIIDYLDTCYPERKEAHAQFRPEAATKKPYVRNYGQFANMVQKREGRERRETVGIYDRRFREFFFPSAVPVSSQSNAQIVPGNTTINSEQAFIIIEQSLLSADSFVQQAALYAVRWFPVNRPQKLIETVRRFASSNQFPHYLYAVGSLGLSGDDPLAQSAAVKANTFLIPAIRKRSLAEDGRITAFNALQLMDLCRRTGKSKEYVELLDLVLRDDIVSGRYDDFQADLEHLIRSSGLAPETLERLLSSKRALDVIVGIRLADLKSIQLPADRLSHYLNDDDAYVRRNVASYLISHKAEYPDLVRQLDSNTNRTVRAMARPAHEPER
jgi:hypothetical protein